MDTEIKKVESGNSPAEMIRLAVSGGADLSKLEKLLELQERYEANEARKAYNDEMVLVHKEIPLVAKTMKNPQTNSRYAALDEIICKTKDVYSAHGFSISFYEGETSKPEHVRICADVLHRLGHKESYYYDVPLDGVGIKGNANMTKIHAKASSTSYGRRYLMCMIWNIPTGDDDDGNTAGNFAKNTPINDNDIQVLHDYIVATKTDEAKFLKWLGVESLEKISNALYPKAINALKMKETQAKKAVGK